MKFKYEVIERDGKFFPRVTNGNGFSLGAWNGYCQTIDQAKDQLLKRREELEFSHLIRNEKIVFTLGE